MGGVGKREVQEGRNICILTGKKRVPVLLLLCGSQQTVENSSRDWNMRPPYLLLRNLYAGQETTVRNGHGTMDWFQIGKRVCPGCILSPCSLKLYTEYIIRNAWLDEGQTGIKVAGRYISNFR